MKRILHIVFAVCLGVMLAVSAAASDDGEDLYEDRLYDGADLLCDEEEEELLARLDEIRSQYSFDAVIVTVNSLDGKEPEAFADDFYDYGGYGVGSSYDGVLMLLCPDSGDLYIYTYGQGQDVWYGSRLEDFFGDVEQYLTNSEWYSACELFISENERYLDIKQNGEDFDVGGAILISAVICIIAAVVVTSYHKGELKSVAANQRAEAYIRQDSMNMTHSNDIYLFSNVTRTRRQTNNGGSGGRSHTSSSGRSHGGGGRKF